jgi:hypothetical protein
MVEKDKKRFWGCMKAMMLNAGQENIDDPAIAKLYFQALQDFSIERVEIGVLKAMRVWKSSKVIPLGIIIEQIETADGKPGDIATVIASEIISHLRINGSQSYPDLGKYPTAKHLMATRWPYRQWASSVLESELKWWTKEFCEAYASYSAMPSLPQIANQNDRLKMLTATIGV